MKYIYLSLFFLGFCFTACQKNSDIIDNVIEEPTTEPITTIDFSWWAIVEEEKSLKSWGGLSNNSIHNATVKLMFKGAILWESNTDKDGRFTFPDQLVPAEGAYFLFEAPGYYNNVVQIEGETIPSWRVHLMRNTYPNIQGELLTDAESYITLTGILQDPSSSRETWYYITNADNELIGTSLVGPEQPRFYMTTLPNEKLFLHYQPVYCGDGGVVELGPFSESEELGSLVDQSIDFSHDYDLVTLSNITDCNGEKVYGHNLFYKRGELTLQVGGNTAVNISGCGSTAYPILLSVATQNPRKYVEVTVTHTTGQRTDAPDQIVCDIDDDTFLKYNVENGSEKGGDVFTVANILPNGQMVLKQAEHSLNDGNRLTMVFDGSAIGSHTCDFNLVVRYYTATGSWSNGNSLGGSELSATITKNDGTFVEGTFSGEVMDTEEVSLGNLVGSFRARIQ